MLFALLTVSNVVVIARFQATIASLDDLGPLPRLRKVISAVLLTLLGAITCVGTSVATFWNLDVLRWDMLAYLREFADRHLIHFANISTLVVAYAIVIACTSQRIEHMNQLSLLGVAPTLVAILAIYLFYGSAT